MSKAVRVLHILPSIQGYGAERIIVELLKHLPCKDVEAALLTIYDPDEEARASLPFIVLSAGRNGRSDMFFLGRLVRQIRRFAPDIVHTHTHVGKYWGRFGALLAGVKKIVHTEHNPCDFRNRTTLERLADWWLDRATVRIITFFREQSDTFSEAQGVPIEKLVVIPNGLAFAQPAVDRAAVRKRLAIPANTYAVLMVGRMEFQKNHILALRAFSSLSAQTRDRVLLFFAGSGEGEEELRRMSFELGCAERVRFLGYRNDVPELLAAADLVLMTSWFEGMPLSLLEAMLASVPVLTTPWIGARNMLGDGRFGFLATDYETATIAAHLERALTHPVARNELAARARRHAEEEYGMGRMTDAHRNLYLQLHGARA